MATANRSASAQRAYDPTKSSRYVPEIELKDISLADRHYDPKKGGSSKPNVPIIENINPNKNIQNSTALNDAELEVVDVQAEILRDEQLCGTRSEQLNNTQSNLELLEDLIIL